MFGHTFYHALIRKYVALFGTLFNDVYINRPDAARNIINTIKIPVSYGPRDKVLAKLTADPNLDRMPAISLPRMSFEIASISYASSRKLTTVGKRTAKNTENPDQLQYIYNPVPYDIDFTLSIMVKNTDDGARIVEQILPFFTPEWTTTVQLIPDMDIVMDIPVILNNVVLDDQYESNFETRRVLIWTLTFTMKAYLFGPIKKSAVIKFANTNLFSSLSANSRVSNITIEPGLTANGDPTTDANNTISSSLIEADDDYGYIITVTNYE